MDRKTLALLLTELVLVVALVVVIAMDFNSHEPEKIAAASHEAVASADAHKDAAPEEAVKEEAAAEEAAAEEHAEAKEEKKTEEKKHVEKEEKAVAKKEEPKAAAPAGGGAAADVIAMNNPAYAKHKKGIVQFTHKKHFTEYKVACGECHHDDSGEPLKELKEGDAVQGCIECHPNPGKAPKDKKDQKTEYHTDMLHANCIDCHKDYNKKNNTKDAPTSCGKCHPKNKK